MRKIKFPTAQTILLIIAILVTILTWIVPAGKYDTITYNKKDNSFIRTSKDVESSVPATQQTLSDLGIIIPLEKFTGGDILMKNGQQVKAWLNYNSLSEQMIFDENGKKLAITENQLKLIDTIYLNNRKFCRIDNTFLELLYHSKNNLYAEYKCRLEAPGTTNGYGGNSQTSSNSSFSSIEERGIQYELSLPAGYKAKPYTIYWLKRNGKMSSFKNINQLRINPALGVVACFPLPE